MSIGGNRSRDANLGPTPLIKHPNDLLFLIAAGYQLISDDIRMLGPIAYHRTSASRRLLNFQSSLDCPQISNSCDANGSGNFPGPKFDDPRALAKAADLMFCGSIVWMTFSQPRSSKT